MSDDRRCTAWHMAYRCEGEVGHYLFHHFGAMSWPQTLQERVEALEGAEVTKEQPRFRLTDKEWDALIAASVAWDGLYMDEIEDAGMAEVRRERDALNRALAKVREASGR